MKTFTQVLSESEMSSLDADITALKTKGTGFDVGSKKEMAKVKTALKRHGFKLEDPDSMRNDDGAVETWSADGHKYEVAYDYAGSDRGKFHGYVSRIK